MTKTNYDEVLITKLKHLQSYPSYLPHIGNKYEESTTRIMIIAESHYLHEKFNNKFSVADWYENPELVNSQLNEQKSGMTTRAVIRDYLTSTKLIKPYTIFRNLENAYRNFQLDSRLFEECVFINYFQRPSQKNGDSIIVHTKDSLIALENLLALNEILKPNKIIFVSSKAYNDFKSRASESQKESFAFVASVPHASSPWWNKTSPKFGVNEEGKIATGREKFMRIISLKKKQN